MNKKPSNISLLFAFTVLELLVSIAIAALLTTLVVAASRSSMLTAKKVREANAAKQLVAAYLLYAADHNGELMKAYESGAELTYPNGDVASGPEVHRFPWRLAEYMEWQVDKALMVNEAWKSIANLDPNSMLYRYMVSLAPTLGINSYCVGGYLQAGGTMMAPNDVVTRLSQATNPSSLLAFASARTKSGTDDMAGSWFIRPPYFGPLKWSSGEFDKTKPSLNYGNVDFRYSNQAVAAFLDGSVRFMKIDELRDMRYWATKADSPSYSVKPN